MLQESHDEEQIIARIAALDIGKAELVCCVRVPAPDSARKRLQEVSTHSTMTGSLIRSPTRFGVTTSNIRTPSRKRGWLSHRLVPSLTAASSACSSTAC